MKPGVILFCLLVSLFVKAQCPDSTLMALIKTADKVRAASTKTFWDPWETTPFNLLLVTNEHEFVWNDRSRDSTFRYGCDSIQFRKSGFNKNLLATFHLINGKPTVVIGTPANTGKTPEAWVATLLHEHFHQLQFAHPEYVSAQNGLDLANGDPTGMWMLNYPFPYADPAVVEKIKEISLNLLTGLDTDTWDDVYQAHLKLKQALRQLVSAKDYRYLNLQLWQEGYARFVEIRMLEQWIENFEGINQKRFAPEQLMTLKEHYYQRIKNDLSSGELSEMKRTYFYSLGAVEAMLIEHINPDWKAGYFSHLFTTDPLLETVVSR